MRKLKTAVVGFGFMGKTHALNILKSDSMELTAIVDQNFNNQLKSSGNFDTGDITPEMLASVNIYSSANECLEKEKLDLIFVCVHTLLHYEIAMEALKKGVHVFVEKPFVLDIKQGEELIAEASRRNVYLGVGHVVRFMPAYEALYRIFSQKEFGELKFITLSRFTGVPNWGDWKLRKKDFGSSGGALFDLVIHDIDYLHYLLGIPDKINSTYFAGELSEHDYICALWKYDGSAVQVKVEGGDIFHSKFPFEAGFKACFDKATVIFSSANGGKLTIVDNENETERPLSDANDGFKNEDEYFAQCIIKREYPDKCSGESALETIRICYKHI